MADERRIFPVETVLALVNGKEDANVDDIAKYILGRSTPCAVCAKAAAPFALAWLARWYPKFNDLEIKEDENWASFVRKAKFVIGDNISITPMTGRAKKLLDQVLDSLADVNASLLRQTEAAVKLEQEVRTLEPLKSVVEECRKKQDQLENQIKKLKADLGAAQRTSLQYQGKIAMDNEELMQTIKDAIKDGLKGLSLGAAVSAGTQDENQPGTEQEQPANVDEFGFGGSSTDSNGFGF